MAGITTTAVEFVPVIEQSHHSYVIILVYRKNTYFILYSQHALAGTWP